MLTLREFIKKYERYIGIFSIVLGFVWDSFTLASPDRLLGNITIIFYLLISAGGIILLAIYARKGTLTPALLLALVQFSFGNLAGSMLFLYGKSGTFEGSYLFLLVLAALIIGNEFSRSYYARMNFNIAVWYFLLTAYLAIIVPVILGRIGDFIFLLSGIMGLAAVFLFTLIIYGVSSRSIDGVIKKIIISVSVIFALFNTFYFFNIIPPVPLSLRDIGIYHSIDKLDNGNYKVLFERPLWYEFSRDTKETLTLVPGDSAYCFSSVFAPVRLETGINHVWEYYDEPAGKWQASSVISFPITGGRDNGYRGYSQKGALSSGRWRCSVETTRGALIGRTTFIVAYSTIRPVLSGKEL